MALLLAVLWLLGDAPATSTQQAEPVSPPPVPVQERGLAKGERLPRFEAVDQYARRQRFETLKGRKGLVLLFVRSADW